MSKPRLLALTDVRARRSHGALRDALLKLLKRKPFDQITVRSIAAAANIGYTTFFRHHPSKDALLDDLAADEIARLVGMVLPVLDAGDRPAACLRLCTYVHQNRALWSALLTGGAAGTMRAEFLRRASRDGATRAASDSWLPFEIGNILAVSGIVEVLSWWLRQPDPLPVTRISEILHRGVFSPLPARPNKARRRNLAQTY
jgi:AcrR family transcriptional regulator